jgi:alpha-D-ribose 1-methylphosphonate 5-triphosphate synthase subunit PhnH
MTISDLLLESMTQAAAAPRLRLALDPVRDTQAIFRVALMALSRPGRQMLLPVAAQDAPGNRWAAALLITLLDPETSLAVEPFDQGDALAHFVRQRTSARAASRQEADFVLASAETLDPAHLVDLRTGSLEFPDDSATLVLTVPSLMANETGVPVALSGPGIPVGFSARIAGLTPALWEARAAVVADYPRGVDLLVVDNHGRLIGLPRSTRATVTGAA